MQNKEVIFNLIGAGSYFLQTEQCFIVYEKMGKCYFSLEWTNMEQYKDWLLPDPKSKSSAKCGLCVKTFDVSNMGEHALKSHAKSVTHKKNVAYYQERDSMKHAAVIPDFFISSNRLVEILFMT